MNSLMISWLIKIGGVLLLIVALVAGYFAWAHHLDKIGYDRATKEWEAKERDAEIKAQVILARKNEEVRKAQSDLQETQSAIITKSKELENAKAEYNKLRDSYVTGSKRLSIATSSNCQSRDAGQNKSIAIAAETDQARAELLPQDSANILDAARGSAEDVRDLNMCIDLYNAVKDTVNKE